MTIAEAVKITDNDVLAAWMLWKDAGKKAPFIKDKNELQKTIRQIQYAFRNEGKVIFMAAAWAIAQSDDKKWPTKERIERAVLVQHVMLNDITRRTGS